MRLSPHCCIEAKPELSAYATAPGKNCPVNRVEQLAVLPQGAVSEPFGGRRYEVHSGEA